ncbi:MAG: hypothetical protein WC718_02325 [Phycisphaerales bacterium]|jgi:hypothetical protein
MRIAAVILLLGPAYLLYLGIEDRPPQVRTIANEFSFRPGHGVSTLDVTVRSSQGFEGRWFESWYRTVRAISPRRAHIWATATSPTGGRAAMECTVILWDHVEVRCKYSNRGEGFENADLPGTADIAKFFRETMPDWTPDQCEDGANAVVRSMSTGIGFSAGDPSNDPNCVGASATSRPVFAFLFAYWGVVGLVQALLILHIARGGKTPVLAERDGSSPLPQRVGGLDA